MLLSRLLAALAVIAALCMLALDWALPTALFYSPYRIAGGELGRLYAAKKAIEVTLSVSIFASAAVVLRSADSRNWTRYVVCASVGAVVAFWSHRDLLYLLLH